MAKGAESASTRRVVCLFTVVLALFLLSAHAEAAEPSAGGEQKNLADILDYISAGWNTLTRSMASCQTVAAREGSEEAWLYLPANLPMPAAVEGLVQHCPVRVERLPAVVEGPGGIDLSRIEAHGLLYLPNPYVVPGGRFNEMYGWDSYFILLGLLREGNLQLARGMVENFFFEIEHYGMILNANRTYFLTRSQPPFLTSMIMAVYEAEKEKEVENLDWLAKAYRYAERDYRMWIQEPHLAGSTGLSRYYGLGEGVSPELARTAKQYFSYVIRYLLRHGETDSYLVAIPTGKSGNGFVGPSFSLYLCDSETESQSVQGCQLVETLALSADFYKGDRSMRESGFDVSFRFGPFSGSTHHYAPVCLNSLLYKAETDLEQMSLLLGREREARQWRERARVRQERIHKYLWDSEQELFLDFDFLTNTPSTYEYASTFYPLWVGLASPEQARGVAANLGLFEQPGGLAMSQQETKAQWDYPYGWAPVHLIAIEGLRAYGYEEEANRIALKFLSMVVENFRRDGTIREKYNVVTRSTETQVAAGYEENVIGFGWTNGVFLELLQGMSQEWRDRLGEEARPAVREQTADEASKSGADRLKK